MSNVIPLQPGDNAGLEPLGKYRASRGISSTMKDVFDVLYEAGEPLDVDTIAERTFARASGAAQGHARRWLVRRRQRNRRQYQEAHPSSRDRDVHSGRQITLAESWRPWIASLVQGGERWGSLLRKDGNRYCPNPDKPPRIARPDGRLSGYTREMWEVTTAEDRAIGEVQTMRMEAERLLGGLDKQTLEHAIELAAHDFAKQGRAEPRATNAARALRSRIGWLLQRPTTDAARAWLLEELVHRAYGSPR